MCNLKNMTKVLKLIIKIFIEKEKTKYMENKIRQKNLIQVAQNIKDKQQINKNLTNETFAYRLETVTQFIKNGVPINKVIC